VSANLLRFNTVLLFALFVCNLLLSARIFSHAVVFSMARIIFSRDFAIGAEKLTD
jgi:hypothetical protein